MKLHVAAVRPEAAVGEGLRALEETLSLSRVEDWLHVPATCDLLVGPSGDEALKVIRDLRARSDRTPALLIAPAIGPELLDCLRLGGLDFVTQPVDAGEVSARARTLLERRPGPPHDAERDPDAWVARSPIMRALIEQVRRVAPVDIEVLITGETGTGKELVARALHALGPRASGPFVPVDCGAIPSELMEAELFGHARGAFTGAEGSRPGLLEVATGGTFFLDEVGELPAHLQAKLLRVLQERRVRRVGGRTERAIDVRLLAATTRNLDDAVRTGAFRQDLMFRINAVRVELPPLRARGEDVVLLAERFGETFGGAGFGGFTPEAVEALLGHAWPGNVRELQNVVRRAIALGHGRRIGVEDLPEPVRTAAIEGRAGAADPSRFFSRRARELTAFEREYLIDVLRRSGGDARGAAEAAALSRATFYRLLKKHGLHAHDFRPRSR